MSKLNLKNQKIKIILSQQQLQVEVDDKDTASIVIKDQFMGEEPMADSQEEK